MTASVASVGKKPVSTTPACERMRATVSAMSSPGGTRTLAGLQTTNFINGNLNQIFLTIDTRRIQAGLQPFQRITHPLKFEFGLPAEQAADLDARIKATPPRFIVLDGYTQHSYGTVVPDLAQVISDRYEQIVTVPGGKYPVQLYQLREVGPPP